MAKKDLYQAFKDGDDIEPDMRLFHPYKLILGGSLLTCVIIVVLVVITKILLTIGS
jgi:hypothetical protein